MEKKTSHTSEGATPTAAIISADTETTTRYRTAADQETAAPYRTAGDRETAVLDGTAAPLSGQTISNRRAKNKNASTISGNFLIL